LWTQLADGSGGDLATPKVTRIKVCCVASLEEMQMAVHYGASAVGLVSAMPSGPGVISEEVIAAIAAGCGSLSISPRQKAATVIDQQRRTKTSVIQLCDQLCDRMAAEAIRNSTGNWKAFGSCR
jgi:phosphoribosylanthranilate isomerase